MYASSRPPHVVDARPSRLFGAMVVAAGYRVTGELDVLAGLECTLDRNLDGLLEHLGHHGAGVAPDRAGGGDDVDRASGAGLDRGVLGGIVAVDHGAGRIGLVLDRERPASATRGR